MVPLLLVALVFACLAIVALVWRRGVAVSFDKPGLGTLASTRPLAAVQQPAKAQAKPDQVSAPPSAAVAPESSPPAFDRSLTALGDYLVAKVLAALEPGLKADREETRLSRAIHAQMLFTLDRLERAVAKTIPDLVTELKGQITAQSADVAKITTVAGSIKAVVEGLLAQNAALKLQIQQLIDAGGDPAVIASLQEVVDGFTAQEQAVREKIDEIAASAVAGTPSA